MTAYTVTRDQVGVYEIPLSAGVVSTVAFPPSRPMEVMVHSGASPVYVKAGLTVAVQDQGAIVIPANTWSTVPNPSSGQMALISAAAAVVSVYSA